MTAGKPANRPNLDDFQTLELLQGPDVQMALRCARIVLTLFQGRTPPKWLHDHIAQLESFAACGSATKCEAAQGESSQIGTAEAARILGCSTAWIRKIHADLDGHQIANGWIFDRKVVEEYALHRNENRTRAS